MSKEDSINELNKVVNNCQRCPLYKTRKNLVFGEGNINTEIMFIGEGPGQVEDETGHPFVGKSGKLLDEIFDKVGIKRENVYIANIVKCRVPNNADPSIDAKKSCYPYLCKQVKIINPKIIVCLGRIAATAIIDPNYKITKEHGKWYKMGEYHVMGTYHPSALLRNDTLLPDAINDFKSIPVMYEKVKSEK